MSIRYLTGHPRDITGEALTAWANDVLETIADGGDLAPLVWESGQQEATYPDALAYVLPELTMSHDSGDEWGSVLGSFFPLAGVIDAIGYAYDSPARVMSVPAEWGYRPAGGMSTWERDDIPADDAWERLATVAHVAIHKMNAPDILEGWMVESDEASMAVDLAVIASHVTGEELEDFPDSDDEAWETIVAVLLAAGWCLHRASDNVRAAGLDY